MRYIDSLQVLRFVAALLVVLYHIQLDTPDDGTFVAQFKMFRHGGFGVDLFFVISGFVIYISATSRHLSVRRFLSQRFWRIYPPYWIVLAIALLIAVAQMALTGDSATYDLISWNSAIISVFLLPTQTQIYPVAWTLTLEVAFYLIFCLSYKAGGIKTVIFSLIIWYLAAKLYYQYNTPGEDSMVWFFHSIVLEFLFGVMIGHLCKLDRLNFGRYMFPIGLVLFSATLFFDLPGIPREIKAGIPAALLIAGLIQIRWSVPRLLMLGGESSYLLYLVHPLVFSVLAFTFGKLGWAPYANGFLMLGMVIFVTGLSMALTIWIERPYISWYKGRARRADKKLEAATAP